MRTMILNNENDLIVRPGSPDFFRPETYGLPAAAANRESRELETVVPIFRARQPVVQVVGFREQQSNLENFAQALGVVALFLIWVF